MTYMSQRIFAWIAARAEREEGQAMVEYALLAGLISVVAILALQTIGTNANTIYAGIGAALGAVTVPTP